jgi:hypothetical protein
MAAPNKTPRIMATLSSEAPSAEELEAFHRKWLEEVQGQLPLELPSIQIEPRELDFGPTTSTGLSGSRPNKRSGSPIQHEVPTFAWPHDYVTAKTEESIPTMSTMPVLKLETPHTTQPVSPDVPPPVIPSAAGSTTPTTPERIGLPGLNGGQIHVVRAHQVQIYLNSPDKNGVVRVVQYNTTAPQHVGTTVC